MIWQNKAITILSDQKTLDYFKENALTRAKDFDLKKILPRYIAYYEEVIAKSSGS